MSKDGQSRAAVPEVIAVDGRRVAFSGGRGGPGRSEHVVAFFHPAPGSGVFTQAMTRADLALVGVDRPGYGHSAPMPDGSWATVASAADDAAAVLSTSGASGVTAVGWSAGGRVALALAARHPDLVDAVVVFGTPAPHEDVPWIPPAQHESLTALHGEPPEVVHARLAAQLDAVVSADTAGDEALGLLGRGPADDDLLADAVVRASLAEMIAVGFRQGRIGLAQDIAGFVLRPWGFQWGAVRARTLLVYGDEDPVVGVEHGSWWARALPASELEVARRAGHISVLRECEPALRWARDARS